MQQTNRILKIVNSSLKAKVRTKMTWPPEKSKTRKNENKRAEYIEMKNHNKHLKKDYFDKKLQYNSYQITHMK